MRKKCPEEQICPVIRDLHTCAKEESFCAQLQTCTAIKPTKCPQFDLLKIPEFEIVHIVQMTVETGHQYMTLTDTPEVFPGDMIAFVTTMAKVAYRYFAAFVIHFIFSSPSLLISISSICPRLKVQGSYSLKPRPIFLRTLPPVK